MSKKPIDVIVGTEPLADEFVSQVSYLAKEVPELKEASDKLTAAMGEVQQLLSKHFPGEDWQFDSPYGDAAHE